MKLTIIDMYWLTRLDGIKEFFWLSGVIAMLLFVIVLVFTYVDNDAKVHRKKAVIGSIIGLLMFVFGIMTPTTNEMAAIIAVPQIVNNKEVQKLPNKVLELSNMWLEKQIVEMKAKNVKSN